MKNSIIVYLCILLALYSPIQAYASFETSKDDNNQEINVFRGELFTERVNIIDNQLEITSKEDSAFLNFNDSDNGKSIGFFNGANDPNNRVKAQIGSIFINHSNGELYLKTSDNGGDEGWELAKGTTVGGVNKNIAKIIQTNDQQLSPGNRKINLNSIEFDDNGLVDISDSEIIIKDAGKYLINGALTVRGLDDIDNQIRVELTVNGNFVAEGSGKAVGSQVGTASATTIMELEAGDQVSLHANNNSNQPVFTIDHNNNQRPRLSIAKLDSFGTEKQEPPKQSGTGLKLVSNAVLLNFGNNSFSNGTLSIAGHTGSDTPTAAVVSIQLCAQSTSVNYTSNTFTFTAPGRPTTVTASMKHAGGGTNSGSCNTGQYIIPVSTSGQIIVSRSNAASSAAGDITLVGYYYEL